MKAVAFAVFASLAAAQGASAMAKLRHIALSVPDPERAAKLFEQAFGMTRAGNAMRGIELPWWFAQRQPADALSFFAEPSHPLPAVADGTFQRHPWRVMPAQHSR